MTLLRSVIPLALLLAAVSLATAAEQPIGEAPGRAALEKQFVERLRSVVLEGTYTTTGEEAAKPDRYEIASVAKLQGDLWLFQATRCSLRFRFACSGRAIRRSSA